MSLQRDDLTAFLKKTFSPIEDYCHNGLQVEGKDVIKKVVFGVSFSEVLLERAIRADADAIFVHHGFFGQSFLNITGALKRKVSGLLQKGISLFGYHLPLDAHPEHGHNVQLARHAGLEVLEPHDVGYVCGNPKGLSYEAIISSLNSYLDGAESTGVERIAPNRSLPEPLMYQQVGKSCFWKFTAEDAPKRVFICSGGSAGRIGGLKDLNVDLFILGETNEYVAGEAMDDDISILALGHWRSEQPGIWAMMRVIQEKLGVQCEYISVANNI